MRRWLIAVTLAFLPSLASAGEAIEVVAPTQLPMLIVSLRGQSNADGRAAAPPNLRFLHHPDRIFTYLRRWVHASGLIADETGKQSVSLTHGKDEFNAGPTLADELATRLPPNYAIGVIPCARGGTSIDDWAIGGTLDRGCRDRIAAALAQAPAGSRYVADVFYQGETDADSNAHADAWPTKYLAIAAENKSRYGPGFINVFTVLGPDPKISCCWARLQSDQQTMTLPAGVLRVSATDLVGKPGNLVHLDTNSQITLGRRYGAAIAAAMSLRQ